MPSSKSTQSNLYPWLRWFERLMALVALANLGLVIFDLSYLSARDVYLKSDLYLREWRTKWLPSDKKKYLKKVDELKVELQQNGLQSPSVEPLLEQLRQLSIPLVTKEIFRVTDQYGSLEEIKNRFQERVGTPDVKEAVENFWSRNYLAQKGWEKELDFFDNQIRFLMNFYEPKLFYDPLKGIEPNRDTQKYLRKVDELKIQLNRNGLESPTVNSLMDELRSLSKDMIDNDPFKRSNKTGTLEDIKNRMRRHIYSRDPQEAPSGPPIIIGILDFFAPELFWATKSSTVAFNTFWSRENFAAGWEKELAFFDNQIRFLMQTNYYRHIGKNSEFLDRFWLIDLPFILLFLVEFLGRTWLMSRRKNGVTWLTAMQVRWYDIFLLLPFWRWLRVIPVTIRLNQAEVLDIEPIRNQISIGIVATFAEELTQVVVINVINQLQGAVERGDVTRALLKTSEQAYIDINNTNEMHAIASRLLQLTVCQVLPKIQPDLEAILHYQIEKAMKNSAAYQGLSRLPIVGNLPTQIAEGLVAEVSKMMTQGPQNTYKAIANAPPDPIADKLSEQMVEHFSSAMRSELQKQQTITELQSLVSDLLEEIKLNYIKGTASADRDKILEETQHLRHLAEGRYPEE